MPLREAQPEEDPATLPSQDARDIPEVKTGHVLFTLQNVKVSATLGVGPQSSSAYYPVLDTGAGPNIIRKDTLYVSPSRHWPLRPTPTKRPQYLGIRWRPM